MTRSGSSGLRTVLCTCTKAASSTAPSTRDTRVVGLPQESVWAREKPKTIANRPAEGRMALGTSIRGRSGLGGLESRRRPPTTAKAAKNRLTYKHQRHDRYDV